MISSLSNRLKYAKLNLVQTLKGWDSVENLDVDGMIILTYMLMI